MKLQKRIGKQRKRRRFRVRNRIKRDSTRPRLSVFRSHRHLYAQIIDDEAGQTLVAACTLESSLFGPGKNAGNIPAASQVGSVLAERAKERGITKVIFDRGENRYHGRVAALATAAREGGLEF